MKTVRSTRKREVSVQLHPKAWPSPHLWVRGLRREQTPPRRATARRRLRPRPRSKRWLRVKGRAKGLSLLAHRQSEIGKGRGERDPAPDREEGGVRIEVKRLRGPVKAIRPQLIQRLIHVPHGGPALHCRGGQGVQTTPLRLRGKVGAAGGTGIHLGKIGQTRA